MRSRIIALSVACLLTGCSSLLPGQAYIEQDRKTFEAVTPILQLAATSNPDLKPAIDDKIKAWDQRLIAAEKAYK